MADSRLSSSLPGTLAWGCWRLDHDEPERAAAVLDACDAAGIRVLDTAPVYGYGTSFGVGHAERLLGAALAARPHIAARSLLVTKCGLDLPAPYDSSDARIDAECDASLERLGVDAIDLYLVHRPDLLTPFASLARTLDRLVESGRVRAVGVSNFSATQVEALQRHLHAPLSGHQFECSVLATGALSDGTLDQCQAHAMPAMAWSPLAGGALFGAPATATIARVQEELATVAGELNTEPATVALAFVLGLPSVMPVIGTQTPERIRAAARATELPLSRGQWYRLLAASRGAPMP